MNMTHYMELLAVNQPWNLIMFMAIPVILAETLAITELYRLLTGKKDGMVKLLNKVSGILAGLSFLVIIPYLLYTAVIPLTISGAWRGFADVVAVGTYLLGGLPLIYIALQELGLVGRNFDEFAKLKAHVFCVSSFLVLAHIAMIFGMIDPSIFGFVPPEPMNDMMDHSGHQM